MATSPKKTTNKSPHKAARPKHLPHGRWLGDFEPLSDAEQRLVECCRRGDIWTPDGWDWENIVRPTASTAANRIRATLIRFLALGGDDLHPVHEEGVMVRGAWIPDILNLHHCCVPVRLDLKSCYFARTPIFAKAQLSELALNGSMVPGVSADGVKVDNGVFMRDGFAAVGQVRFLNADINANVECSGGSFSNENGDALSLSMIKISGGLFLGDGFAADGEVSLIGAQIGGNFECGGGRFTNPGGAALTSDGIKVLGGLFLREASIDGSVWLSSASVGTLIDDGACWKSGGHLLDGFYYDRIIGPVDAASRIAWLKLQRVDQTDQDDWAPQPWEQLIKVMREMGHPSSAAEIAIEKQRMMRKVGQIGTRTPQANFKWAWRNWLDAQWAKASNATARTFHDIYGILAGYGHRPMRIAAWMVAVWLFCGGLYWAAADGFAAIGPADPTITSPTLYPDADRLCGHGNEPGKTRWTECPGVPDEYSTFQPFIYSLDVILPLIDLQQEVDWAPIAEGPTGRDLLVGVIIRWVMWFEILFGWLASLMFVAIVSRLVNKD